VSLSRDVRDALDRAAKVRGQRSLFVELALVEFLTRHNLGSLGADALERRAAALRAALDVELV
jgi:hypothetical protein